MVATIIKDHLCLLIFFNCLENPQATEKDNKKYTKK